MINNIKNIFRGSFLYNFYNYIGYKLEFRKWAAGDLDRAPHILKRMMLKKRARDFGLKYFIETGTFFGDMTSAMQDHFDLLITIELDNYLYARAKKRFEKQSKIKILHGDSGIKIIEACAMIDAPALFWLDAHYSGGITAHGDEVTPIFAEIKHILAHHIKNHVVVIDDARLFNGTDGYPTYKAVSEYVAHLSDKHFTWIENDTINISPI